MSETLTDEERHLIWYQASERGAKALRIIDALVAQLDRQKRLIELSELSATAHRCKAEELTRERDEALELARNAQFALAKAEEPIPDPDVGGWQIRAVTLRDTLAELNAANTEVARLTKALAAAERDWKRDAEALAVNETTRAEAAEARVEALETLLAASEARAAQWQADAECYRGDSNVARARLEADKTKIERATAALVDAMSSDAEAIAIAREVLRG